MQPVSPGARLFWAEAEVGVVGAQRTVRGATGQAVGPPRGESEVGREMEPRAEGQQARCGCADKQSGSSWRDGKGLGRLWRVRTEKAKVTPGPGAWND